MKKIDLKGVIVPNDDKWIYDWFEMDSVCPRDIIKGLNDAAGDDVTIEINSPGGEIAAGSEIYCAISGYSGKTCADITGHACSAATYAACGADTVRISPAGLYMIHNVSCSVNGNHQELEKEAEVLQTADRAISNIYVLKTGKTQEEILDLMEKTTWMDAQKAVEYGFVDEIINVPQNNTTNVGTMVFQNAYGNLLSEEVKNKIRNTVKCPESLTDRDFLIQKMQSKLNLMKLGGRK